jgi:hypothetical protein
VQSFGIEREDGNVSLGHYDAAYEKGSWRIKLASDLGASNYEERGESPM